MGHGCGRKAAPFGNCHSCAVQLVMSHTADQTQHAPRQRVKLQFNLRQENLRIVPRTNRTEQARSDTSHRWYKVERKVVCEH